MPYLVTMDLYFTSSLISC